MKKTLFFGLIAAALGFTACSSEDDAILGENIQKKGMVLNATIASDDTRATMTADGVNYDFAFASGDIVKVTNSAISNKYYTFTNDGTNFRSDDAQTTASAATWYAYFPSEIIDLANQGGTLEAVANKYAVVGTTASATTGEDGLSISMSPKVAILKIVNQKGSIDISAKLYTTLWLKGMTASNGKFDVAISTSPVSLFSTTTKGTYYVAVPAGVQLAIKDGNDVLKSTKAEGLAAGKYYNLTISGAPATTGSAAVKGGGTVNWVQLWADGPKFAEKNIGANSVTEKGNAMTFTDATKTGDEYAWGANWCTPSKEAMEHLMTAAKGQTDDKVKCEYIQEGGVYGFKFTGLTAGYTDNSVFFPAQYGDSNYGDASYRSGTASGVDGWVMILSYYYGSWYSKWFEFPQDDVCLVRPVLKN